MCEYGKHLDRIYLLCNPFHACIYMDKIISIQFNSIKYLLICLTNFTIVSEIKLHKTLDSVCMSLRKKGFGNQVKHAPIEEENMENCTLTFNMKLIYYLHACFWMNDLLQLIIEWPCIMSHIARSSNMSHIARFRPCNMRMTRINIICAESVMQFGLECN